MVLIEIANNRYNWVIHCSLNIRGSLYIKLSSQAKSSPKLHSALLTDLFYVYICIHVHVLHGSYHTLIEFNLDIFIHVFVYKESVKLSQRL